MRIFLRHFPDIKRDMFLTEDAYNKAMDKQNKEIYIYRRVLRKIITFFVVLFTIAIILGVILGGISLYKKIFQTRENFSVTSTVLNKRNIKLDDKKLYKQEDLNKLKMLTVCIDPGHGGEDYGEVLKDDKDTIIRSEKKDNLAVGIALKNKLEELGINVIMTRNGDTKHSNQERCSYANESDADIFISLHRNINLKDSSQKGVEIYTPISKDNYNKVSFSTGEYILQYLNASGISKSGGTHAGSITSEQYDFQINRETDMASLLIELGYISNEEDNVLFDINLERYASAITYGIIRQFVPDIIASKAQPGGSASYNKTVFDYEDMSEDEEIFFVDNSDNNDIEDNLSQVQKFNDEYNGISAYFSMPNEDNEVYLSFEVGSDAGHVRRILDILKDNSVKAVFFVNYTFAVNHPDLINAIIDEGHDLGNNTCDYPQKGLTSIEEKEQASQILDLHEYILYKYNYCMHLFRFPNGYFNKKLLARVNNYQYKSIFWSYSYNDYTNLGFEKSEVLSSMEGYLRNGIIFNLRTDSDTDAAVLDDLIKMGKTKNIKFRLIN